MLSEFTFSRLNIRQQIHKISQAVREAERQLKRGADVPAELSVISEYRKFLKNSGHPKTLKAAASLTRCQNALKAAGDESLKIQALNFCFYELLELMNESPDEQYFDPLSELFDREETSVEATVRLQNAAILDNLRSPFNVGSIFRSADCFGTGEIALCGITPRPPLPKLERSAMGCTEWVPWLAFEKTAEAVRHYRKKGYAVVAVEKTPGSVSLQELEIPEKTAFIFGNEEFGITRDILRLADQAVVIPQVGLKNSMNVSNAFALVMYSCLSRRGHSAPSVPKSKKSKKVEG